MIALGSDHGGYELKCHIMEHLEERGIPYEDFGCYDLQSCDYPDFGRAAAKAVAGGRCERGIVVCTTGIGISIAANKVAGIRCALCTDPYLAKMTRLHNDANMLALMMLIKFQVVEIPAVMHMRKEGKSMHSGLSPFWYMFRVCYSILIVLFQVKVLKMDTGVGLKSADKI